MPRIALLPFVICALSGTLTWAMARFAELSSTQRALAAQNPRSRPYSTTLPDSLINR